MGNLLNKEPPPPMVLVPPLFDFPPLSSRTRMMEPSYDMLFGKLALKCLFEDYFEDARSFSTRIMLKPIDDPNVDLIATLCTKFNVEGLSAQIFYQFFLREEVSDRSAVSFAYSNAMVTVKLCQEMEKHNSFDRLSFVTGPLDQKAEETVQGNALFRWQRDVDDPNTFMDLFVSNSDPVLRMRSCAYYPKYGLGAFGSFPLLTKKGVNLEDRGFTGLRYASGNLSFGATFVPFSHKSPNTAWLVSKIGRLTTGVQYTPNFERKDGANYKDLANWSCAIGYGLGSTSPLSPSYNFSLELARSSQLIASFYQHVVVQRRVKNPFEEDGVVGITNYIDFGFELDTRIDGAESSKSVQDSAFQIAASWQANKNFLFKGKMGTLSSSLAVAFKSWWKPSFTFSISAVRDRKHGNTSLGFGIRIEDLREASYQRADPNYVMLTPTKEHLAEGIQWKIGSRPMLQSDVDSENFEGLPRELRPFEKIL